MLAKTLVGRKDGKAGSLVGLIDKIRADPNFKNFRVLLSVGDNGDLLTEMLRETLRLKPISSEELPFYPVYQVLVIGEDPREFLNYQQFEAYGYKVFMLNE